MFPYRFSSSLRLCLVVLALVAIQRIDAMSAEQYAALLDRLAALLSGAPIKAQEIDLIIQTTRLVILGSLALTAMGWAVAFVRDNWNMGVAPSRPPATRRQHATSSRRPFVEGLILALGTPAGRNWLFRLGLCCIALGLISGVMSTAVSMGPDLMTFMLLCFGTLIGVITRTDAGRRHLWRVMRGHYRQIHPMQ